MEQVAHRVGKMFQSSLSSHEQQEQETVTGFIEEDSQEEEEDWMECVYDSDDESTWIKYIEETDTKESEQQSSICNPRCL